MISNIKMMKTFAISLKGVLATGSMLLAFAAFAQKDAKLTDPEIAKVAVVANQNDIDFATIAKSKSKDADILKFAETMSNDHKMVIDKAVALVTKLHVTPQDNDVSKKLLSDAANTKTMLSSKSGSAFNKAYIDNEVAYHKAVINAVENVLIPDATNQELKDLLQSVVPVLKTHLEHAEMVQKKVNQ